MTTTRGATSKGHLPLVAMREPRRPVPHHTPRVSLRGAPFRPGELPTAFPLELPETVAETMNEQARRRRVPVELVIRSSLDAARAVSSCPLARSEAVAELDDLASAFRPLLTGGGELLDYRHLLLRGEPGSVTRVASTGRVEVLVPLDLATAWRCEAAGAGRDLGDWAATLLAAPPDGALSWEAASAGAGARLTEWAYAALLRRIASPSD